MEKIELPLFKKYYMKVDLNPITTLTRSCYRNDQILYKEGDPFLFSYKDTQKNFKGENYEQEFSLFSHEFNTNFHPSYFWGLEIDANVDDLEKLILYSSSTDRLVQCLFESPEDILNIEIIETSRVFFQSSIKNIENQVYPIFNKKLDLTTEELITRFSNNQMIKDLYEFILTLRERRITLDIELQTKAEEHRDYNQYMSWKMLEQMRLTGRFQKFVEREQIEAETSQFTNTKIVDSVENTGASFSIKKDDNGSN